VIKVMIRLKVHHLAEVGRPHVQIAADLGIGLRSVERIVAEPAPTPEELAADARSSGPRRGRPSAVAKYEEQIRSLLAEFPDLPGTEVLRRSHDWGYRGSRSPMLALVTRLRPPAAVEPVVRFEGLPGEFAQFDFGHAKICFTDGKCRTVHFFCGRLKHSRYVHVLVVPNEQAETLIRAILSCLVAFGGSPKQWVFDNPKTVRISPIGEPLVLHPYLRDLVADMNVLPEMCAPRSGNQKGSVESLVKFTKRGFLFARPFRDLADLEQQLVEWLDEVNTVRPCAATGAIPRVVRDDAERVWLEKRPVRWAPRSYPIRESRTISPMGTVPYAGTPYSTPPEKIGATATLLVGADTIEMHVPGAASWTHARRDGVRTVQRLTEHRRATLTVIHGRRKHNYFKRECLLELGPAAHDFLEQLIHRYPGGTWAPDVDLLFDLLDRYGDHDLRQALVACHHRQEWSAYAVARELAA
jgi:transposase